MFAHDRNIHSVVEVARLLAESSIGSRDRDFDEESKAEWLEWRVSDAGWRRAVIAHGYAASVRIMALEALKLWKKNNNKGN